MVKYVYIFYPLFLSWRIYKCQNLQFSFSGILQPIQRPSLQSLAWWHLPDCQHSWSREGKGESPLFTRQTPPSLSAFQFSFSVTLQSSGLEFLSFSFSTEQTCFLPFASGGEGTQRFKCSFYSFSASLLVLSTMPPFLPLQASQRAVPCST